MFSLGHMCKTPLIRRRLRHRHFSSNKNIKNTNLSAYWPRGKFFGKSQYLMKWKGYVDHANTLHQNSAFKVSNIQIFLSLRPNFHSYCTLVAYRKRAHSCFAPLITPCHLLAAVLSPFTQYPPSMLFYMDCIYRRTDENWASSLAIFPSLLVYSATDFLA